MTPLFLAALATASASTDQNLLLIIIDDDFV